MMRAVDDQQHQRDHPEGDEGDQDGALAADFEVVGEQRCGAGDVGLDPRWCRRGGHDVAHGVHGLVGQGLALVAPQVHLHVGGFAVLALRGARRQRVPPEVLDVFDVGVVGQLLDQGVVEVVGVGAQGLLAFEHDHRRAVGIELAEDMADVHHRLQRRRIRRALRHRMGRSDHLQLRRADVRQRGDGDPEQHDGHRQAADPARHPRTLNRTLGRIFDAVLAHADLSRQAMYPFTLLLDLSSVTMPLTVMRQPIVAPSP